MTTTTVWHPLSSRHCPAFEHNLGLWGRIKLAAQIIRGRQLIDAAKYEKHAQQVAEHNHRHCLKYVEELDRIHMFMGETFPCLTVREVANVQDRCRARWNGTGTDWPWP